MSTESKVKYTEEQVELITSHNSKLIAIAESTRFKFLNSGMDPQNPAVKNQAAYWRNVACGLRWANSVCRQMVERRVENADQTL